LHCVLLIIANNNNEHIYSPILAERQTERLYTDRQ